MVAVLAACAMIGGPIAAANASDITIKLALLHAAPVLHRSDLRLRAAFARYANTHRAGPVIRAVRAQDRDISALQTTVRRSSASTGDGSRGRRDIIAGLGYILRSNYGVNGHLRRQGAAGLSPSQLRTAQRLARRGSALYRRGIKLLLHS
ncbi:MAG TPA: hypothetical protein VGL69_02295 [Solirubrobacteraceae bacterium]